MKLFLDSANPKEISEALARGTIRGITTNPSILAKEKPQPLLRSLQEMVKVIREYSQEIPLSVEVTTLEPKEMIKQAMELYDALAYPSLYIKIPIG